VPADGFVRDGRGGLLSAEGDETGLSFDQRSSHIPTSPPPQSCPTSSARNRLANGGAPLTGSGSLILLDVGENRRALRSKWREEQRPQA
jgi:hypothetical protein